MTYGVAPRHGLPESLTSLWRTLRAVTCYATCSGNSSCVVILTLCSLLVAPSLPNTVLHYRVEEELPLYSELANLRVDSNLSAVSTVSPEELRFSMLGDPERNDALQYLSVNATSSILYIKKLLDREEVCEAAAVCQLTFGVAAHSGHYFHMLTILMDIEDLNDNIPTFKKEAISIAINENSQTGIRYTLPSAVDKDSGLFGVQSYSLESTYGVFEVEHGQQVKLIVEGDLDRETTGHYLLHLLAYDGGYPPNAGLLFINVTVVDVNDNRPVFNASTMDVSLPEDTEVPSLIGTLLATDADFGSNGLVRYAISEDARDTLGSIFEVDAHTGEVFLIEDLDYEARRSYTFEVKAFDQGSTSHSSFATVNVEVVDVNDNAPRITVTSLSNDNLPVILENSNPGVFVAHVTVSDDDSERNGEVICDVSSDYFRLEALWGSQYQVLTAATFDREETASYDVILTCRDRGVSPMYSDKLFKIYVGDENDNKPVFSQPVYSALVSENNAIDDLLLTVETLDLDIGNNGKVNYSVQGLAAQLCYVENTTGAIRAKVRLDYEQSQAFVFNVEAVDNGTPPLSSVSLVNITVRDLNDEPPAFLSDSYEFSISENHPGGMFVGAVSASDPDTVSPDEVRYFFRLRPELRASSTGSFRINPVSGQIETDVALDREERAVYDVEVCSHNSDNISLSSTVHITIKVTDENDNPPRFLYPSLENNTVLLSRDAIVPGTPVATLLATDPDEGLNADLSYSLRDNNGENSFAISEKSGAVTMLYPPADDGFLVFQLEVAVRDNGVPSRNATSFFYVAINGSLTNEPAKPPAEQPPSQTKSADPGLSGTTLTAFICIVAIAGVLISVLLAAIAYILWRNKKRRRQGGQGHVNGVIAVIGAGSPDDNFNNNLNNSSFHSDEGVVGTKPTQGRAQGRPRSIHGQGPGRTPKSGTASNQVILSPVKEPNYMQVQRFLELMDSEEDSEELSNADSGNGTSLEGETPVKKKSDQGFSSKKGRDARRLQSPRRLLQMNVPCPSVPQTAQGHHKPCTPDIIGSRACRESTRNDFGACHESGSSVSSDEVFGSPDIHQPKHGILKTKLREKKLNSQRKAEILSPSQARVRFQPNLPEPYDSPDLNTDSTLADQNSTVIHLDNDEMEITI